MKRLLVNKAFLKFWKCSHESIYCAITNVNNGSFFSVILLNITFSKKRWNSHWQLIHFLRREMSGDHFYFISNFLVVCIFFFCHATSIQHFNSWIFNTNRNVTITWHITQVNWITGTSNYTIQNCLHIFSSRYGFFRSGENIYIKIGSIKVQDKNFNDIRTNLWNQKKFFR